MKTLEEARAKKEAHFKKCGEYRDIIAHELQNIREFYKSRGHVIPKELSKALKEIEGVVDDISGLA